MNVLFLSRLFYPHIGGVEKHVYELSKQLIKKNHKVIIVTEKYKEKLKDKEILEEIEIYRIPIRNKNWFKKFDLWFWLFKNRILIEKADIIHCHDVFFWYLPLKLFFLKKKVFTTFHGYENYPVSKKTVIIRKISEILSSGNICVGDFMKKWYFANPDAVIYGGVDKIKKKGHWKKKESAIFIGRLDEQTSILTYLGAFKILREKIKNFQFLIIGDGKYKDKAIRETRVLEARSNAKDYFVQYHFVFVSRYLSMLEAMIAKRLVFAVYDNPIKKDYLEMSPFTKFIVVAGSKEKLADKIIYYLNHSKEEKEKIDKAFNWVKNQNWENIAKVYLKLWESSSKN